MEYGRSLLLKDEESRLLSPFLHNERKAEAIKSSGRPCLHFRETRQPHDHPNQDSIAQDAAGKLSRRWRSLPKLFCAMDGRLWETMRATESLMSETADFIFFWAGHPAVREGASPRFQSGAFGKWLDAYNPSLSESELRLTLEDILSK